MADLHNSTPIRASAHTGNVIGPHVIARKREQRDARRKLIASTMAAEAQAEEAAAP